MEGSIILCSICAKDHSELGPPVEQLQAGVCAKCGRSFPTDFTNGDKYRVMLDGVPYLGTPVAAPGVVDKVTHHFLGKPVRIVESENNATWYGVPLPVPGEIQAGSRKCDAAWNKG